MRLRKGCGELTGIRRGIEKESLRGRPGRQPVAAQPSARAGVGPDPPQHHHRLLGSATRTHHRGSRRARKPASASFTMSTATSIPAWTTSCCGWPPCPVSSATKPTFRSAVTGPSNIGTAKTVYRLGLGHRYGRLMQTISGIHYNFSLPKAFWDTYAALLGRPAGRDFVTDPLFRSDPQLPPARLAVDLALRCVARHLPLVRAEPRPRPAGVRRGHALPALCHVAQDGAAGVPERCPERPAHSPTTAWTPTPRRCTWR